MHTPSSSPWPAVIVVAVINLAGGAILTWHYNINLNLRVGLIFMSIILLTWFYDMYKEMNTGGHNSVSSVNVRFAMVLFIASEVLFFAGFFWGYFHSCWKPEEANGAWATEEYGVVVMNPLGLPLQNTLILLGSGVCCTLAHENLLRGKYSKAGFYIYITVGLGAFFVACQAVEYISSGFSGNTSSYGTLFFLLTGFHGLHVFIGASLLILAMIRLGGSNFSEEKHVYLEAAAWYWHFVDVVWLGLYLFIYWYG
uniref:Cytochrome c oxidase subunit 3 n=1 Tax=Prosthiostomum siphunculus TaxID=983679 RepID=A0A0P0C6R3_9PLAT|nr:cytochrome c oxidase subunit III [Prosthiostomum siphunculus]ALI86952.1 cytochrome c oxidase subunit III [Prosthiostomum siphunculus]